MQQEMLHRSSSNLSQAVERLYYILEVLRGPDGCPWDRDQTIDSFYKNILEEAYEYLDSYFNNDVNGSHEELGDLFLVISMLGMMHEERDNVSLASMLDNTSDKLIRRHPHVFAESSADNSDEVLELWDSIKQNVEGKTPEADNYFNHVPKTLPPLDRAQKIQKKAASAGFDWDAVTGTIEKLREELDELEEAVASKKTVDIEEEIGDILFSIVNISRHLKVTSSIALHRTNEKFMKRFNMMRKKLEDHGVDMNKAELSVMEDAWNQAKNED